MRGEMPSIEANAFNNVKANVYYLDTFSNYNSSTMLNYGGNLTWKKGCKLLLNANGGDENDYQVFPSNEVFTLTTKVPIHKGYVFQGWASSPSAITAQYQPGQSVSFSGDKRLYAVWKESESVLSIYALTNNQSILVKYDKAVSGNTDKANYVVTNSAGQAVTVSYAGDAQGETGVANTVKLNFSDPLLADTYTIQTRNMGQNSTCEFEISLHLSTYRIVDSRNVIIQLNEPIIGCTTAENYVFHSLAGEEIQITSAVSAFQEIGGEAPNVFRLTTAKSLQPGTTYVVETRGMSWNGKPCQGTIGYFTMEDLPESKGLTIYALTNNQSILVRFDKALSGMNSKNNYVITNSAGKTVTLSYAGSAQGETGVPNTVKLNFPDPLPADMYHIKTRNMGEVCECDFEISLNLTVYRFVDKRNVIIQLNEPIIGCTTAENYEFHTLSGEVIPVTSAVSAFQEIGGEAPNVFRLTTGKDLKVGTTYVVETRGMSWNGKPCQGTIAYITP